MISIDCGAIVDGFHGDSATTLVVGGDEAASQEVRDLIRRTREGDEVQWARRAVPVACRAAGVVAIDTPEPDFKDMDHLRADAAFAKPEIYEALETRGVPYAIRIPANKNLELSIEDVRCTLRYGSMECLRRSA